MPHLQVLDLSFNLIKKIKIIDNHIYYSSSPVNRSALTLNAQINFSLVSNLILNELVYLNLNGNYLNNFPSLFSISSSSINDSRFCNLTTKSKIKLTSYLNNSFNPQRPLVNFDLKNNTWKCDCFSFELYHSILGILNSSPSKNIETYLNSCYLNHLVNENIYLFRGLINLTELNCYNEAKNYIWQSWFNQNCQLIPLSKSNPIEDNLTADIVLRFTPVLTVPNIQYSPVTKLFKTTKIPYAKQDLSTTFYWISCVCIGVITIACLIAAWFFCWKRYKISRQLAHTNIEQGDNELINRTLNRNETVHFSPRRNLYFLNNRFQNQMPMWRNLDQVNRDQGLYFISLNQNNANNNNNNNSNFLTRDDEPPNYYEAVLYPNRNLNKVQTREQSNERELLDLARSQSNPTVPSQNENIFVNLNDRIRSASSIQFSGETGLISINGMPLPIVLSNINLNLNDTTDDQAPQGQSTDV